VRGSAVVASAEQAGSAGQRSSAARRLCQVQRIRKSAESICPATADAMTRDRRDPPKAETLLCVADRNGGIGEQENVAVAEDLAEAMGAAVSCSRPVVDAKWMDKSRQVGSSGQTVRPKVYLACGISGSFQHLAGIKGSPFMVAVNKNAKAPIFRVADVGIVDDMLEFLPALADRVREESCVPGKERRRP